MKNAAIIILLLLFNMALLPGCKCRYSNDKLEYALALSGSNRGELEKVLAYYSKDEKDSLHLKAALFLIENMPGHYTLENEYLKRHRKMVDSLYPNMSSILKSVVYTLPIYRGDTSVISSEKSEDLQNITSNFLIEHINNRIQVWRKCSWLSELSFENFCDYLLPYRVANEPLMPIDSSAYLWRNINKEMSDYSYTPYFMEEIRSFQTNMMTGMSKTDTDEMEIIDRLDCLDIGFYTTLMARNLGIPATTDLVFDWATRNGRHSWYRDIDLKRLSYTFDGGFIPLTGKVYRRTYSHNLIPKQSTNEFVPIIFQDPFFRDVTEEYIKTGDVNVCTKEIESKNIRYVYLSVFNDMKWKPAAWATNINGKAFFTNMGCDIIYVPTYYIGDVIHYFSNPFYIRTNGAVHYFSPDTLHTVSMCLRRKYPLTMEKLKWGIELIGCCLEGANNSDFKDADTLVIVKDTNKSLNWTIWDLNTNSPYRYWRLSKNNAVFSLSEIEFYDVAGNELRAYLYDQNGKASERLYDKNKLSFDYIFNWVAMDLGRPVKVSQVYILPHTDDNGICIGDTYELFYYNNGSWHSLGTRIAEEDKLVFHKVPSNAVYLLRNLNVGKEERIFTYQDSKVRFW